MNNPKDIPAPMTAEEIKKVLSAGGLKIELSESPLVDHYDKQIGKILVAIGRCMEADDIDSTATQEEAEIWARGCYVSDLSTVSDFGLGDGELKKISKEIGTPITHDDYICAIAARIAGAN